MSQNIGKKFLSIVLSTVMVFSIFSGTVFADDTQNPTVEQGISSIGKLGTLGIGGSNMLLLAGVNPTDWGGTIPASDPSYTYSGGDGMIDSPYLIANSYDLAMLAANTNVNVDYSTGKCFKMTADIDLNPGIAVSKTSTEAKQWTPIGNNNNYDNKFVFKGVFDGDGHTVKGVYINSSVTYQGLFGFISNATIKNVGVIESFVTGIIYVGAVVGNAAANNTINNCFSESEVIGVSYVGGIAGAISTNSSLVSCYNTGDVDKIGSGVGFGGMAGFCNSSIIEKCYNTGSVTGQANSGGIVGILQGGSTVKNCVALCSTVSSSGTTNVTRVVGFNNGTNTITDCYARRDMKIGLIGSEATITNTTSDINGVDLNVNKTTVQDWDTWFNDTSAWNLPVDGKLWYAAKLPTLKGFSATQNPILTGTETLPTEWDGTIPTADASDTYSGGNGTQATPYLIANSCDLAMLAANTNAVANYSTGKYFKMTANIDLNPGIAVSETSTAAKPWTPIGNNINYNNKFVFNGVFDGDGHTVKGVYINNTTKDYQGLFGYIDSSTIKNVGVVGSYINGAGFVGAVVGHAYTNSTLQNCYNSGTVAGDYNIGGVAGRTGKAPDISTIIVENCYNTGNIIGNSMTGGVLGDAVTTIEMKNCYNTGNVTANVTGNAYVGGVLGNASVLSSANFENCYNTGNITGNDYVGGFAGSCAGTVKNCYNTGDILGLAGVGGMVGNSGCIIQSCYNTGNVTSMTNEYNHSGVGGIAGCNQRIVMNCYNTGKISGRADVGGVVGSNMSYAFTAIVQNCYNSGDILHTSLPNKTGIASGIAGYNEGKGTVKNCVSLGDIITADNQSTIISRVAYSGTIDECYARGDMKFSVNGNVAIVSCNVSSLPHGKDLKFGQSTSQNWSALFSDTSAWNLPADGKLWYGAQLPTLKGFSDTQNPILTGTEPLPTDWEGTIPTADAGYIYSGGNGTQATPYLIANSYDLAMLSANTNAVANYSNGKYFKQTAAIDLSPGIIVTQTSTQAKPWTPIGTVLNSFQGIFDGNGYTINGVYINDTTKDYQGLFGYTNNAIIKNTAVVQSSITGRYDVGGVVGLSKNSTVENCFNNSSVTGATIVGGVVGNAYQQSSGVSLVQNCYNIGKVSGEGTVGGVVGTALNATTVQNCYNTGNVTTTALEVGGVLGRAGGGINEVKVINCVSLGLEVTTQNLGNYIGRVVGRVENSLITNCYARSDMQIGEIGKTATVSGTVDNKNGADLTVGTGTPQDWNTWFSGSAAWTYPTANLVVGAKLPTLNGFGTQNPTLPSTVTSTTINISGTVKDSNGSPVASAKVTLTPAAGTTVQTTGADGKYSFKNIPTNSYTITITFTDETIITTTVPGNSSGDVNIGDITKPSITINITTQPQDVTVLQGKAASFSIEAKQSGSQSLSYQWYKNTVNSTIGGSLVIGATSEKYTAPTAKAGTTYYYCVVSSNGTQPVTTNVAKLTVTAATDYTGTIEGTLTDGTTNAALAGVAVKVMKGGTEGTQFGTTVTTKDDGKYEFKTIPYGSYSLVATKDTQIVTKQINISEPNITQNLVMLSGNKNTKVEVKGQTPSVAAVNLTDMFNSDDNLLATQPAAKVEIKLVVEKKNESDVKTDAQLINSLLQKQGNAKSVGIFLDAKLLKTITGAGEKNVTDSLIQPPDNHKVKIVFDIPEYMQARTGYLIIRVHDIETLPITPIYDPTLQTLTFDGDKFSTYAIAYDNESENGGNGSNGGSDSDDGNSSSSDLWQSVEDTIKKAADGDTINVNAHTDDKLDVDVMNALQNKNITLIISWSGGDTITIPAGKAQSHEAGRIYYPLSLLEELYKNVKTDEIVQVVKGVNPEAGGVGFTRDASGKLNPITGRVWEVEAPNVAQNTITPITPPTAGLEQNSFTGIPNASNSNHAVVSVVLAAMMLAILIGGACFFSKQRSESDKTK